ncbi:MAG: bluetail domain-containing putative surface protein, partial [Cyanobacteria bacterium J06636_16]
VGVDVLDGADDDDILGGGRDRDTLTGGTGSDTFRYLALNQSLLADGAANTFDRITDLVIGTDSIDSIDTVSAANVIQANNVIALNEAGIQAVLSAESFVASGAATFTFNSRTFLALNDSTAGYQQASDALIEITGYSGDLTNLEIV